jgi:adenylate cyclase class 2
MTAQHDGDTYLEIEAKLLVPDLAPVRARLENDALARRTKDRVHEANIRYEDARGTLTAQAVALRLRRDRPLDGGPDRVRLTYKAPAAQHSSSARTRFEAEVEVSDFETMDLILQRLGYQTVMLYEKFRTTYTLEGAEVVLDEMPFGAFVEVEGAPDAIEAAIARLGLEAMPRFTDSYVVLFAHVKHHLGLTCRDLTFANFAGVTVPAEAFTFHLEHRS